MGDEARHKGQRIVVDGECAAVILARGMLLGNEIVGVVEGHKDDDQPAQRIRRPKA